MKPQANPPDPGHCPSVARPWRFSDSKVGRLNRRADPDYALVRVATPKQSDHWKVQLLAVDSTGTRHPLRANFPLVPRHLARQARDFFVACIATGKIASREDWKAARASFRKAMIQRGWFIPCQGGARAGEGR
jgi:hypothetical protein